MTRPNVTFDVFALCLKSEMHVQREEVMQFIQIQLLFLLLKKY